MRSAVDYAVLIGKWVDVSRPATDAEAKEMKSYGMTGDRFGMSGVIISVRSLSREAGVVPLIYGVELVFDYGYGIDIWFDNEHIWELYITTPHEEAK